MPPYNQRTEPGYMAGEPDDEPDEDLGDDAAQVGSEILFGVVLAGAVSIGLSPLVNEGAYDLRYTLVWGMLALFGVMAWLLGTGDRIEQEAPEDLAWGITFGLILGLPVLAFGGGTLAEAGNLLFREMPIGTRVAYLVFVMPVAETLFFRGIVQQQRSFWQTGLLATGWQIVLFFPLMNQGPYPLIIGALLLMANTIYSYVRERNGLAAAWLCQITVNLLLFALPVILG